MKHNKVLSSYLVLTVAIMLTVVAACNRSQKGFDYAGAEQFARTYMQVIDEGNLNDQMDLVSRSPEVSSTIMGQTWHGWEAIRKQSETYVAVSKVVRNALGKIKVVALASDVALVLVPFRNVSKRAEVKIPEFEQSLTLVLQRTPQGWRMIHEHVSVNLPPPQAEK